MTVFFSLLIANYNNGKFFRDCYHSILKQTYHNWEVVIVDDGSTDGSVEMITNITGDDKRFRLYQNDKNYGCGYTKRRCIEFASGEICGFIDPDDALLPNALQKMHAEYVNNGDAVLIHSNLIYCNESLEKQFTYPYAACVQKTGAVFLNLDHSVTAFTTFKRSAYLRTEGIDAYLQKAVDQDLYIKMYETGPFQFINEPLYLYRRHPGSISSESNMEKARFWHWFAIMQAAKRRNIIVDELFTQFFISRKKYERLERKMLQNKVKRLYNSLSALFKKFAVNKRAGKEYPDGQNAINKTVDALYVKNRPN
jgi:glycosyltransferase involved in cell wall biosynthesis